ncbi:NADPH oxidase activator-like [Ruditapes philippinarum]|uniref:NADPH oxidase activator-like n=1 Tax=Ruditapes philippinarum TaxID=129788 RepID=UPI00295C1EE4|nr:NADPH oxidase activator-like [Ruditapes philippinarum]
MVEHEQMKETLLTWNSAVELHNSGNYNEAIENYYKIKTLSARMRYNIACAEIKLNNVLAAIKNLTLAIELDNHLAIAFFLRGTLYLQRNSMKEAISDLEMARALLRGKHVYRL